MFQNALFRGVKLDPLPIHHGFGGFKSFRGSIGGKTGGAAPGIAGNKVPGKATAEYIGAYPNDGTCVKHGIDTYLAVISHH